MNITQYSPEKGILVSGTNEQQKLTSFYNSLFSFMSNLITTSSFTVPDRDCIDSCWESSDFYYINSVNNKVYKNTFAGTNMYSLQLTSPTKLSIIQNAPQMSMNENVEDYGCWIIDGANVIKTDNQLVVSKIISLTNPQFIFHSRTDNGCYVIDNSTSIYKFNSDGDLVGIGVTPGENINQICVNSYSNLFILGVNNLFKYSETSGNITLDATIDLSSYFSGTLKPSCLDINTSTTTQHVLVAGGDTTQMKIVKFNKNPAYVSQTTVTGEFPYVIKIPQHPTSNTFYVLTNNNKY